MIFFVLASISGFLAVAFGAFGAHALKADLSPEMMAAFETGVRYQFYHTFVLFTVARASRKYPRASFKMAGWWFVAGIVLFSGSLYLLAYTGTHQFGAVTPVGGMALLGGWLIVGWEFWRVARSHSSTDH